jgi:hypothetical protein
LMSLIFHGYFDVLMSLIFHGYFDESEWRERF